MPRLALQSHHFLLDVATATRRLREREPMTTLAVMKCSCGESFEGASWADALFALESHFEKHDKRDMELSR